MMAKKKQTKWDKAPRKIFELRLKKTTQNNKMNQLRESLLKLNARSTKKIIIVQENKLKLVTIKY